MQKADAVERALELLPALLHGTGEPDTHTEKARLDAGLYLGRLEGGWSVVRGVLGVYMVYIHVYQVYIGAHNVMQVYKG